MGGYLHFYNKLLFTLGDRCLDDECACVGCLPYACKESFRG